MNSATDRVRKSENLTTEEFEAFKKWVDDQPTKLDACLVLEFSRPRLDRLYTKGSGKPESIAAIKKVLATVMQS